MKREEEILKLITNNPSIEQSEIASALNIKRSTVAVHIANLQKKGLLLGRGYIVNKENYVLGIGAANVDIYGKSNIKIKQSFDHPAHIYTSVGGVTRNVCENLARFGTKVKLIACVGDDVYGQMIKEKCQEVGIDVSNFLTIKNKSSNIFMQILNDDNDMYVALCDMSINENITKEIIKQKESLIKGASVIVLDPSLKIETMKELFKYNKVIFLDAVSDLYAKRIKPYIKNIYCIKCNETEAEVLSDIKITDNKSLELAADSILKKGCQKVYISLGDKGAYYKDNYSFIKKKISPVKNPKNASGCGDAFFSAVVNGYLNGYSSEKTMDYALAAGKATIMSEYAINPNISEELIKNILKEN